MAEKVSRDRGYRSDTIAISRDMGPLRQNVAVKKYFSFQIFGGETFLGKCW